MHWTVFFVSALLWVITISRTNGQPTIPENHWNHWWPRPCEPQSMTPLETSFNLLRQEVRSQITESKRLRVELNTVAEHNKQARAVLSKLIDTLHVLVSKMALRYPCNCGLTTVPTKST